MTATRAVAVAGAGIGGLAAAIALSRKGFQVRVYEKADRVRAAGVGLHLGANGSRVLRRWGLGDLLDAVAVRPSALEIRDWFSGGVVASQPFGAEWEREFGAPYYTIHRPDLHRILAGRLPAGTLRLGKKLIGFAGKSDRVELRFADGTSAEADVLVGADGMRSVVRRVANGPESIVFSGRGAFRGVVPAEATGLPASTMFVWAGADRRLLCYPVRGGALLTYVGVVPDRERTESWSAAGDPAALRAAFAGWSRDARKVLAAAGETGHWALNDRQPLARWSFGRVTLLGDAAHPMLPHHGQGASQAIEDAVALAHFLAVEPDPEKALRSYESMRLPHTTRVQLGARDGGSARLTPDRPGAVRSLTADVAWIHHYDIRKALEETETTGASR
ncbi:FAD-dependent monooxygenase [Amycolatopsis sp. NPDC059021]|uniref:FAD-dependent monooxygenase n=1 Tax=Amycolatopsis sp. NPDC059021 TaxID=3346704 RepID=UPI00367323B1